MAEGQMIDAEAALQEDELEKVADASPVADSVEQPAPTPGPPDVEPVIDSTPGGQEAAKKTEDILKLEAMSPRDKVLHAFRAGRDVLTSMLQSPDLSDEMRTDIQKALTYDGTLLPDQTSESFAALMNTLDGAANLSPETAVIVDGIIATMKPYLRVDIGDGEGRFTLDTFQARLDSLTTDAEQEALTKRAKYGFIFPSDSDNVTSQEIANAVVNPESGESNSPLDGSLYAVWGGLDAQVRQLENSGKDASSLKRLRASAARAQRASGPSSFLLKESTLMDCSTALGIKPSEADKQYMDATRDGEVDKFMAFAKEKGLDEKHLQQLQAGLERGLGVVLRDKDLHKIFTKIDGVDEAIFGKKLEKDEFATVLGRKLTAQEEQALGERKSIWGAIMLGLLIGSGDLFKEIEKLGK